MLVLSRKIGERILVGDKVSITVVRIAGNVVRLGIEAPKEMSVVREELHDRAEQGGVDLSDGHSDKFVPRAK